MLSLIHKQFALPLVVDCPGSRVEYDGVNFYNFLILGADDQEIVGTLTRVRPSEEDKRGSEARLLVVVLEQVRRMMHL